MTRLMTAAIAATIAGACATSLADTAPEEAPMVVRHPHAAAGIALPYDGTPVDVVTYHVDGLRTGWNRDETALTAASVASDKFGLLQTLSVDGHVLAQPLLVSGMKMADGSLHDVLVVVTGHNSVYAFDARDYALLWQVNLGPSQSSARVGCSQVTPEYGIESTPVIVRAPGNRAALYLVSATEPAPNDFHTHLHALNLADGQPLRPAVEIAPTRLLSDGSRLRFDPRNQWVRAGLVQANQSIYVAISSHCDANAGDIAGWVQRYGPDLDLKASFSTIASPAGYQLAAIWMTGFAPAVDAAGNLFAITGNGNFSRGGKDWGESVIKLAPDLAGVTDFFTPAAYRSLNNTDADFGSGGLMLLPSPDGRERAPLAVGMGKDGTMYLLDTANLGRVQPGDAGALQSTRVADKFSGVWGGPAFYSGAAGPFVYYQTSRDVLKSYAFGSKNAPRLALAAQGTSKGGNGGSLPIVSSNGAKPGTGVVWVIRRGSAIQLEAYDADTLGAPLYAASAGTWTNGSAYLTPMQANGRVYVGGTGTVSVFGLTP